MIAASNKVAVRWMQATEASVRASGNTISDSQLDGSHARS